MGHDPDPGLCCDIKPDLFQGGDVRKRGDTLAAGGARVHNAGHYYAPTVLADVPRDADVMIHEPFGPIAACLPVDDMDDALGENGGAKVGHGRWGGCRPTQTAS